MFEVFSLTAHRLATLLVRWVPFPNSVRSTDLEEEMKCEHLRLLIFLFVLFSGRPEFFRSFGVFGFKGVWCGTFPFSHLLVDFFLSHL